MKTVRMYKAMRNKTVNLATSDGRRVKHETVQERFGLPCQNTDSDSNDDNDGGVIHNVK